VYVEGIFVKKFQGFCVGYNLSAKAAGQLVRDRNNFKFEWKTKFNMQAILTTLLRTSIVVQDIIYNRLSLCKGNIPLDIRDLPYDTQRNFLLFGPFQRVHGRTDKPKLLYVPRSYERSNEFAEALGYRLADDCMDFEADFFKPCLDLESEFRKKYLAPKYLVTEFSDQQKMAIGYIDSLFDYIATHTDHDELKNLSLEFRHIGEMTTFKDFHCGRFLFHAGFLDSKHCVKQTGTAVLEKALALTIVLELMRAYPFLSEHEYDKVNQTLMVFIHSPKKALHAIHIQTMDEKALVKRKMQEKQAEPKITKRQKTKKNSEAKQTTVETKQDELKNSDVKQTPPNLPNKPLQFNLSLNRPSVLPANIYHADSKESSDGRGHPEMKKDLETDIWVPDTVQIDKAIVSQTKVIAKFVKQLEKLRFKADLNIQYFFNPTDAVLGFFDPRLRLVFVNVATAPATREKMFLLLCHELSHAAGHSDHDAAFADTMCSISWCKYVD
jgi:hypothetical protein